MSAIRQLFNRVRTCGAKRETSVKTVSMGRERTFDAYDVGADTYIVERGLIAHLKERPSVLIVPKAALRRKAKGLVMTVSTGNHSVAAFPLLDGRFWKLSALPSAKRSEVLSREIVCANIVGERLEISQRDVPTDRLVAVDGWLVSAVGLGLGDIVMLDRNESALAHYRRLGQEWRVKPLAWTEGEMRVALAASLKRIASALRYYHSACGVHFLSYAEFGRFATLADTDFGSFVLCLRELVSICEGNRLSFTRLPKHRGHHEIEFFGVRRGVAVTRLVPGLETLMEAIALGRIGRLGVIQRIGEIVSLYRSLLAQPELADENSKVFVETIYMYVTGEIYAVVGEGSTPAFDDRRTALPGATFRNGRVVLHPGADARTEILLSNLKDVMSKDELIEYANVYELRGEGDDLPLGKGSTREVVYKTNRRPLENSLVEKRLSRSSPGYSCYILARIGALRALGVALSDRYLLLKRRPGRSADETDYYIRMRCEGEPMDSIPATYFRSTSDAAKEEKGVVLALAMLMGDAAAQNLAMKKYDPKTESPLYGIGKEIYEFGYDLAAGRILPKRVSTCSIRGSFGWPSCDCSEANLERIDRFYLGHFAHALRDFQRRHPSVTRAELAERFLEGFEFRTHALAWQMNVMRDKFESFDPDVPSRYGFARRWKFILWSLEQQERRLAEVREIFLGKMDELNSAARGEAAASTDVRSVLQQPPINGN